jgi:hypothetical protein
MDPRLWRSFLRAKRFLVLFGFMASLGVPIATGEELLVRLRGEAVGERLRLAMEFGPKVTLAAKVYSEPSHTLLLAVVDTAFAESPEGRAWLSAVREEKPLAVITSSLPAARPTVEVKGRPGSDDQVVVLLVKREATGGLKERVVSQAHVTSSSFAFATFWLP